MVASQNSVHFPTARTARKVVDNEEFVRINTQASIEGHDTKWIAEQLDMFPDAVTSKRVNLRQKGVALPELIRGRVAEPLDVANLNKMIEELKNPKAPAARGNRGRRHAGSTAS